MLAKLDRQGGRLDQGRTVLEIMRTFGEGFFYRNRSGNFGISTAVLKEFKALTPDVVWHRSSKEWWRRRPHEKDKGRLIG